MNEKPLTVEQGRALVEALASTYQKAAQAQNEWLAVGTWLARARQAHVQGCEAEAFQCLTWAGSFEVEASGSREIVDRVSEALGYDSTH